MAVTTRHFFLKARKSARILATALNFTFYFFFAQLCRASAHVSCMSCALGWQVKPLRTVLKMWWVSTMASRHLWISTIVGIQFLRITSNSFVLEIQETNGWKILPSGGSRLDCTSDDYVVSLLRAFPIFSTSQNSIWKLRYVNTFFLLLLLFYFFIFCNAEPWCHPKRRDERLEEDRRSKSYPRGSSSSYTHRYRIQRECDEELESVRERERERVALVAWEMAHV